MHSDQSFNHTTHFTPPSDSPVITVLMPFPLKNFTQACDGLVKKYRHPAVGSTFSKLPVFPNISVRVRAFYTNSTPVNPLPHRNTRIVVVRILDDVTKEAGFYEIIGDTSPANTGYIAEYGALSYTGPEKFLDHQLSNTVFDDLVTARQRQNYDEDVKTVGRIMKLIHDRSPEVVAQALEFRQEHLMEAKPTKTPDQIYSEANARFSVLQIQHFNLFKEEVVRDFNLWTVFNLDNRLDRNKDFVTCTEIMTRFGKAPRHEIQANLQEWIAELSHVQDCFRLHLRKSFGSLQVERHRNNLQNLQH